MLSANAFSSCPPVPLPSSAPFTLTTPAGPEFPPPPPPPPGPTPVLPSPPAPIPPFPPPSIPSLTPPADPGSFPAGDIEKLPQRFPAGILTAVAGPAGSTPSTSRSVPSGVFVPSPLPESLRPPAAPCKVGFAAPALGIGKRGCVTDGFRRVDSGESEPCARGVGASFEVTLCAARVGLELSALSDGLGGSAGALNTTFGNLISVSMRSSGGDER